MLKFMSKLACLGRLFVVTCFLLGGVGGSGGSKNPSQETSYKGQRLYEVFKYVIIM